MDPAAFISPPLSESPEPKRRSGGLGDWGGHGDDDDVFPGRKNAGNSPRRVLRAWLDGFRGACGATFKYSQYLAESKTLAI